MEPVIQLDDLSCHYRSARKAGSWVLDRIGLRVTPGEYLLLCGASGSGKSTLAYLLNGLIPHLFDGIVEGRLRVTGLDPGRCRVAHFLDRLGMVMQNTEAQLFNPRVEGEIAYGPESLGLERGEIHRRIQLVARKLHIQDLLKRFTDSLSGGEKRLVAIASELVLNPPILVLDEPFAHLDEKGTSRLRQILKQLHLEGRTLVIIEQRVETVLGDVTRCVMLDQGRIVFDGTPRRARPVFLARQVIPRYPRSSARRFAAPGQPPLLQVQGLSCRTDSSPLFTDVSFSLQRGQISALVGRVGSGKTTLIRHLNGLTPVRRGRILLNGTAIGNRATEVLSRTIGLVFQNPNDQFFRATVREEILAGPRSLGRLDKEWLNRVYRWFDLKDLEDQSPYRLSEGQKKRVAVACILALKPQVLILDEPTVGQDGRFLQRLARLLDHLRQTGMATLLVTHDRTFADAVADQWLELNDGRLQVRKRGDA